LRPDKNDHAIVKDPDGDEPLLAIIATLVSKRNGAPIQDLFSASHIQPARLKRERSLAGVEFDLHFCYYIK
jgi:hypothetical protein